MILNGGILYWKKKLSYTENGEKVTELNAVNILNDISYMIKILLENIAIQSFINILQIKILKYSNRKLFFEK